MKKTRNRSGFLDSADDWRSKSVAELEAEIKARTFRKTYTRSTMMLKLIDKRIHMLTRILAEKENE